MPFILLTYNSKNPRYDGSIVAINVGHIVEISDNPGGEGCYVTRTTDVGDSAASLWVKESAEAVYQLARLAEAGE